MLLSVINTKLRDDYADLDDLCASLGLDKAALVAKLKAAGFEYNETSRQFR